VKNAAVDGLVGNLSHSIVKADKIKGKRFVVLRAPWGEAGWEGPWSDGSGGGRKSGLSSSGARSPRGSDWLWLPHVVTILEAST